MRRCLRGAALVVAAAASISACAPEPVVDPRPPIPMYWPGAAQPPAPVEAARDAGACVQADSLDVIVADTVGVEQLPVPPGVIAMPEAVYPESERAQGWEGVVTVRLLLRPDGRVVYVDVGDGGDPFLASAADAACAASFAPVRTDRGAPAYVWTTHAFRFELGLDSLFTRE